MDQSWARRISTVQSQHEKEKQALIDDWQRRCDQLLEKYQSELHSREELESMVAELRQSLETVR